LLQVGSTSTDLNTKWHTWGEPWDFFSIMKNMVKHSLQKFYRSWELSRAVHLREQGWINVVEASSLSSQKEVQGCAISRENDYCCYLRWRSVGCFRTSQFNNKCSCLFGRSKETQGSSLAKQTRVLTEVVLLLHHA